jgi:hypothetical protein
MGVVGLRGDAAAADAADAAADDDGGAGGASVTAAAAVTTLANTSVRCTRGVVPVLMGRPRLRPSYGGVVGLAAPGAMRTGLPGARRGDRRGDSGGVDGTDGEGERSGDDDERRGERRRAGDGGRVISYTDGVAIATAAAAAPSRLVWDAGRSSHASASASASAASPTVLPLLGVWLAVAVVRARGTPSGGMARCRHTAAASMLPRTCTSIT